MMLSGQRRQGADRRCFPQIAVSS